MCCERGQAHLTDEQRRRVAENLGLVAYQLRKAGAVPAAPTREREWEDLFQEGCLGLIQAVRTYPADTDMPFAAYALPRIHTAITKARRGSFATVRQPLYPIHTRTKRKPTESTSDSQKPAAQVVSLEFDPPDRRKHHRNDPVCQDTHETIGERLHARYVDAMVQAADRLNRSKPARGDRPALVRRIVQHRLLVPEAEARLPLRAIARETQSSYARVAGCEKRLIDLAREHLLDDPETRALRDAARHHPEGVGTPVDSDIEAEVSRARRETFIERLKSANRDGQGATLLDLIDAADTTVEDVARRLLAASRRIGYREHHRAAAISNRIQMGPSGREMDPNHDIRHGLRLNPAGRSD